MPTGDGCTCIDVWARGHRIDCPKAFVTRVNIPINTTWPSPTTLPITPIPPIQQEIRQIVRDELAVVMKELREAIALLKPTHDHCGCSATKVDPNCRAKAGI